MKKNLLKPDRIYSGKDIRELAANIIISDVSEIRRRMQLATASNPVVMQLSQDLVGVGTVTIVADTDVTIDLNGYSCDAVFVVYGTLNILGGTLSNAFSGTGIVHASQVAFTGTSVATGNIAGCSFEACIFPATLTTGTVTNCAIKGERGDADSVMACGVLTDCVVHITGGVDSLSPVDSLVTISGDWTQIASVGTGTNILARNLATTSSGTSVGDVIGPASATDNAIARFDGTTGKIIQNSTVTIDDIGNMFTDGYIQFSEQASPPTPPAIHKVQLYAVDDQGAHVLNFQDVAGTPVRVARDCIFVCKNTQGSSLTAGQVVYLSGGVGASGTAEVKLARANSLSTMPAFGIVYDPIIANNDFGKIIGYGQLEDIDTSAFAEGDLVYVSSTTAGALVATAPSGANFPQRVGIVINSHAVNGHILVDPLDVDEPVVVPDGYYGDITVSSTGTVWTVDSNVVSNTKLADMATQTIKGRTTAGTGDPEDLTATQVRTILGLAPIATSGSAADLSTGTIPDARMPDLTGDVTTTVGAVATTIASGVVTNAKLATAPANTMKGNNTGATASILDLTTTQVKTLLAITAGDVSGLAPIATSGSAADLSTGTIPDARMPDLTGDVTTSVGAVATTIAANAVTFAKMQNTITGVILGRQTAGTGNFEQILPGSSIVLNSGLKRAALTGDITAAEDSNATTLASTSVTPGSYTNASLTVDSKGRLTAASTGTTAVIGPASATDNAIVRFDGTTGKLVQNTSATITDVGAMLAVGTEALPGYAFTADPNTGMYNVSADVLGFAANGGLSFSIDATALFGDGAAIGRYSPYIRVESTALSPLASPLYSFVGDTNTGVTSNAADTVDIVTGGTTVTEWSTTEVTNTLVLRGPAGALGAPTYSFSGGTTTGMWRDGSYLNFSDKGVLALRLGNTYIESDGTTGSPAIKIAAGTAALPTYSFAGDTNTGMYSISADTIGFVAGTGTPTLEIDGTNINAYQKINLAGGDIVPASGYGIDFAADGGSRFDYYEEGTWTPRVYGATIAGSMTYSQAEGYYRRIGNVVFIWATINVSASATSPTGAIRIDGLPYSGPSDRDASAVHFNGISGTTGITTMHANIQTDNYLSLWNNGNASDTTVNTDLSPVNGTGIVWRLDGSYCVA